MNDRSNEHISNGRKRPAVFFLFALFSLLWTFSAEAMTYYISPSGSDANSGASESSPFKSFAKAFGKMASGDELVLLDGTYGEAQGTGYINYSGTNSGQIPSGISSAYTYVHAKNPGNTKIMGSLFVGRSTRKDQFIRIEGITFEGNGGHSLYNTDHIIIKNSGFHDTSNNEAVLGIGSNDGDWGNTYVLIEDSWIWGNDRVTLIVYRSDHVVIRRVVTRNDGCNGGYCNSNSGNYMVGTTIYNSHHVSFQNVMAIDNIPGQGFGGAGDFYMAYHNNFIYPWHTNEWLGTISLNTQLSAAYGFDSDNITSSVQPMATYKNIVAWNDPNPFNAQINCGSGCARQDVIIDGATLKASNGNTGDGLRIGPTMGAGNNVAKNIIVTGNGRYGMNSVTLPSYVDASGSWSQGTYNQTTCSVGCKTSNPLTDGSIKYITRIEAGSPLKGTGTTGADYGANVVNRYGAAGAFYDDPDFNALTNVPLWPWPNEDRIKKEMCTDSGVTRGFCGAQTLTRYIWEAAGNPIPAEIYGSQAPDPAPPKNLRIR